MRAEMLKVDAVFGLVVSETEGLVTDGVDVPDVLEDVDV